MDSSCCIALVVYVYNPMTINQTTLWYIPYSAKVLQGKTLMNELFTSLTSKTLTS